MLTTTRKVQSDRRGGRAHTREVAVFKLSKTTLRRSRRFGIFLMMLQSTCLPAFEFYQHFTSSDSGEMYHR